MLIRNADGSATEVGITSHGPACPSTSTSARGMRSAGTKIFRSEERAPQSHRHFRPRLSAGAGRWRGGGVGETRGRAHTHAQLPVGARRHGTETHAQQAVAVAAASSPWLRSSHERKHTFALT